MFFAASEIIHKKPLLLCAAVLTASPIFNTAGVQGLEVPSTTTTSNEFSDEVVPSDMKDEAKNPSAPRKLVVVGSDGDVASTAGGSGTYLEKKVEATATTIAAVCVPVSATLNVFRGLQGAAKAIQGRWNYFHRGVHSYFCECASGTSDARYPILDVPSFDDHQICGQWCAGRGDSPSRVVECFNEE